MNLFYRQHGKRIFDVIVSGLLLIVLLPAMIAIALAVRLNLGTPVLFSQERPGMDHEIFTLHKFRTMTSETDSQGNMLSDSDRLTRFGKLLRSTSLDELPELWDVLRGRMSLVGPRPLLKQYLALYTPQQARRHEVRPGITGLAQVSGRNDISWEDRFDYDLQYVEECSWVSDLKILAKTIACVFRREGISADKHATCPYFEGTVEHTETTTKRAA